MRPAPHPHNEISRLAALERYGILDTPPDTVLDGIAQAAADLCEVPIALINLIDPTRQWFKTCIGMPMREIPREPAFCTHAILEPTELMEVEDASQDERFKCNPLVTGDPNIRFYAGKPLLTSDHYALGTLCVIDVKPRRLTAAQRDGLSRLAQVVMDLLEERQGSKIAAIDHAIERGVKHGILITDPRQPDNPITYANRAFETMTGYAKTDLVGRNCRMLQGADTDADTIAQLREAITAAKPCTVVLKNYRKDGTAFWNELTVSPVKDRMGNIINFVGVQNDVTDRQIARERSAQLAEVTAQVSVAQASRNQLAQIVEDSVNEIYIADAQSFRILKANRAARENLGYSATESRQLVPWDFVEGLTQENIRELIEPLFTGKLNAQVYETAHLRKDGTSYPVSTHLQFMGKQTPPVYTAIVQDITERQRQEELINLRNRAIEAVDVGVSITDATSDHYPIVYVNQTLCRLTGYTPDELLGRGVRILQKGNEQQPEHLKIQEAQAKGEPIQVLIKSTRKDGSYYMDELSLSPVRNEKGKLTHYITINRDVTSKLETEARLHQAQKIEAIGQLSGGIAHDFNNLLSVITGNLEFLSMAITDNTHLELVNEANNAASMGARLTHRLLTFARQRQLEPVVLNANDHVLGAIELLRSTIGENITLSSHLSPDLWSIRADPSEIENMIVNLAINARDAMPDGGHITVESKNVCFTEKEIKNDVEILPGNYVQLSVIDTGCGMTDEVKARIFEPYYTTKEPDKGTGLGLASIYGFVNQSGGYIRVISEIAHGTAVHLFLPKHEETIAPEQSTKASQVKPSTNDARILVVEDNDSVRKVTVKRLQALGFDTAQADSGPEAVRYLKKHSDVDLLLSDIVMRDGMSGYDLARWVQNNLPECKILLTSGFSEQVVEDTEMNIAKLKLLAKPYTLVELQHAINSILDR